MAALSLRIRRAVAASASASLLQRRPLSAASPPLSTPRMLAAPLPQRPSLLSRPHALTQSFAFRSSAPCSIRRGGEDGGEASTIGPEDILFEGCDYNHWLITIDFPKDPKPTPEEMVETYVQTAAKVVGSVEEAKKRIYACSTTTYEGFQLVCDEQTSEKFRGLPGVVFILPDSFIDPLNKEYGGDKYDNGVITHRPPPIQYDRYNRKYDRPRSDRLRNSTPMRQGNQPFNQQGPMQGDRRDYVPQQNNVPRGHAPSPPPPQGGRNYAPQQNYGPPGGNYPQQNYGPPGGNYPQQNYGAPGGNYPQQNYGPPGGNYPQQNYGPPGGNYAPGGRDGYQGENRDPLQKGFNQGGGGNFTPQEGREFSQGGTGAYRNVGPSGGGDNVQVSASGYNGDYRQGFTPGSTGGDRQGMTSNYRGDHMQGLGSDNGQGYTGPVEGQTESWKGQN